MEENLTIQHIQKTQWIRVFDVFLLGPAMIYAGSEYKMPFIFKFILIGSGIGTIAFNLHNLLMQKKWMDQYKATKL